MQDADALGPCLRRDDEHRSHQFQRHRRAFAAADAQRGDAALAAAGLQGVDQRDAGHGSDGLATLQVGGELGTAGQ